VARSIRQSVSEQSPDAFSVAASAGARCANIMLLASMTDLTRR
jgi:hypothetical protein